MLKVGLTGGIGSGKTTVATIFEVLSIPVYYADAAARRIMKENASLKAAIVKYFGEQAYVKDELNRSWLASIVFNDRHKLDLLNSLVHPITIQDAETWMTRQKTPYVIKEAALLFETSASENLDFIIGVSTPEHLRIKRAMDRDGISREEVLKRMRRQIDENIKMKLCDFVITNDEQHLLIPQVLKLHEKFISFANSKK